MMLVKKLIEKPEHFVVHEIPDRRFIRKFARTAKGVSKSGKYTLYLMEKRNMTTHDALEKVAGALGIKAAEIGYAGLKDKLAVTTQYIAVRGADVKQLDLGSVRLTQAGFTDRRMSAGDLTGNKFEITVRKRLARNIKAGSVDMKFPNYFGEQRFGKNNHEIGRLLVKRRFEEAMLKINESSAKSFHGLSQIGKKRLKFFVHAYQSWIFNRTLRECVESRIPTKSLPIVGYNTVLGRSKGSRILSQVLAEEGVKTSDFRIDELRLACRGTERTAFVRTRIRITPLSGYMRLDFILPKGSYATVALRELLTSAA